MKDNFSSQSDQYAKYRPSYPSELFDYLSSLVPDKQRAWDCGTGNGQVAFELAKTFQTVFATDISQSQIDHALKANNINYSLQPAEKTYFENSQFDLIVVAQAIHWFDFEQFYKEVRRTAKENALICVIGYGKIKIEEQIDSIISDFCENLIGAHWDKERKYLDESYATIPFPFDEIETPNFVNRLLWTLEHLIGYLNTWSAVKHFIQKNGYNPIEYLQSKIGQRWGNEEARNIAFPLLLRVGHIKK